MVDWGWIRSIRLVLRNYIYVNGPSSFVDVLMRPYEAQSLNDYRGMANMFRTPDLFKDLYDFEVPLVSTISHKGRKIRSSSYG